MDKGMISLSVGSGSVARRVVDDVIEDNIVVPLMMMSTTTTPTTMLMLIDIGAVDDGIIDDLEVIRHSDDRVQIPLVVGLYVDEEVGSEGTKSAFGVLFDEMRRTADFAPLPVLQH